MPASLTDAFFKPATAVTVLILAALVVRLALALAVGLGTDEVYTVAISRTLSPAYFDHPPLHQWIAHGSAAVFGEGRLARIPFVVLFAATSGLLFLIARRLYGGAAGFWAVVVLNLSGFFTLSAGSWIVPDGPLLFALALAGYGLARLFFPAAGETPSPWLWWIVAGIGLGLGGLAKYHAAMVALGVGLFVLFSASGRAQLRHPAPYVAALIALALVSPVLMWNAAHGWVSFLFQAGRSQGGGFTPWLAPVSLVAQAGWLLPWVFAPIVAGVWRAWRTQRDARLGFLMALGLPTIIAFTLLPMFGNLGLPHWSMPGWFFLMPFAGIWLSGIAAAGPKAVRWARMSASGSLIVLACVAVHASTGVLARLGPAISRNDPTLETFAWDQLPGILTARGLIREGEFIIADSWQNAGRIDVAMGGRHVVLPGTMDPRHFAFVVDQSKLLGRDGIMVVRLRRESRMREAIAPLARELGDSVPVSLGRGGLAEIELVVIPVRGLSRGMPWAYGLRISR